MSTSTIYILAIPGSDQTREISQEALLEEMAQGKVTPDFWAWSAKDNDWKQLSEFPTLKAPLRAVPVRPLPPLRGAEGDPARQVVRKKVRRRIEDNHPDGGFPYIKFALGLVWVAVAVVAGLNYYWVDKPLNEAMAKTPYLLVPVHAHLGSFVQPGAIVLHILPNQELNSGNFPDFLQKLAQNTPAPLSKEAKNYQVVTLTPAWFSEYAMPGTDWNRLAALKGNGDAIKEFVSTRLCHPDGQPLLEHVGSMDPSQLQAAKDKVWSDVAGKFIVKE